jgi:hypothetical protein
MIDKSEPRNVMSIRRPRKSSRGKDFSERRKSSREKGLFRKAHVYTYR